MTYTDTAIFPTTCDTCESGNLAFLKNTMSNNSFQVKIYCLNCGSVPFANPISFKRLRGEGINLDKIPERDMDLIIARRKDFREHKKQKYYDYLKTPQWRRKRNMVMKRDSHICQICLTEKATEVHHLSYNNIYREPLRDLIAICNGCHRQQHWWKIGYE